MARQTNQFSELVSNIKSVNPGFFKYSFFTGDKSKVKKWLKSVEEGNTKLVINEDIINKLKNLDDKNLSYLSGQQKTTINKLIQDFTIKTQNTKEKQETANSDSTKLKTDEIKAPKPTAPDAGQNIELTDSARAAISKLIKNIESSNPSLFTSEDTNDIAKIEKWLDEVTKKGGASSITDDTLDAFLELDAAIEFSKNIPFKNAVDKAIEVIRTKTTESEKAKDTEIENAKQKDSSPKETNPTKGTKLTAPDAGQNIELTDSAKAAISKLIKNIESSNPSLFTSEDTNDIAKIEKWLDEVTKKGGASSITDDTLDPFLELDAAIEFSKNIPFKNAVDKAIEVIRTKTTESEKVDPTAGSSSDFIKNVGSNGDNPFAQNTQTPDSSGPSSEFLKNIASGGDNPFAQNTQTPDSSGPSSEFLKNIASGGDNPFAKDDSSNEQKLLKLVEDINAIDPHFFDNDTGSSMEKLTKWLDYEYQTHDAQYYDAQLLHDLMDFDATGHHQLDAAHQEIIDKVIGEIRCHVDDGNIIKH